MDADSGVRFVQMSMRECGKQGEVLARKFLASKYKGWKIREQVSQGRVPRDGSSYIVRGPGTPYRRYDFVVEKGRRKVRYEVKSVESISGEFFLAADQLADVDRILLVLRDAACVLDLASGEVLPMCSRFKRIYGWGDRCNVHLSRLEEYIGEHSQHGIERFRIVVLPSGGWCSVECYLPGPIRVPAREFFRVDVKGTDQEMWAKPAR